MEIGEIIEFVVNLAPVPSAVPSDGNESEDEDEFEPAVSSKDAIAAVKTLKTFLAQNNHHIPSLDEKQVEMVRNLGKVEDAIYKIRTMNSTQKGITDFFKTK